MATIDTERLREAILKFGQQVVDEGAENRTADEADSKLKNEKVNMAEEAIKVAKTMISLIRDVMQKRYSVPKKTLIYTAGALAYLILPIDVIHDYIPGIGYSDDAAVIGLAAKACQEDLKAYMEWKKANGESVSEEDVVDAAATVVEGSHEVSLDEYLKKNFGDNEEMWKREIDRLSKLCWDNTVTDDRERAKVALKDLT